MMNQIKLLNTYAQEYINLSTSTYRDFILQTNHILLLKIN